MADAYIFDAVRTPRGRGKKGAGGLSGIHPQQLVAQLMTALTARVALDPRLVEDVIVGCVTQVKEQGACLARNAVLAAQWPDEVAGVTINRFCGSGSQSVHFAAMAAASGFQDLIVAGGVESMSRVPMGSDGAMLDGGNMALRERVMQVPQGISADLIATREGISRAQLDAFAAASQGKAARAVAGGRFARSLVPVRDASGHVVLDHDEHPRPGTTVERLAALAPSFARLGATPIGPDGETPDEIALRRYPEVGAIEHVHHAGSSSGIVDGAALVLVGSRRGGERAGLTPRARVRSMVVVGTEPILMLTAPAPAARRALARAGMTVRDVDLWEINEAFAVVSLANERILGLDASTINVHGGAVALGHPIGASGARILVTLLYAMAARDAKTGGASLCIGGGEAITMLVER